MIEVTATPVAHHGAEVHLPPAPTTALEAAFCVSPGNTLPSHPALANKQERHYLRTLLLTHLILLVHFSGEAAKPKISHLDRGTLSFD